jgi:hypothetical protein
MVACEFAPQTVGVVHMSTRISVAIIGMIMSFLFAATFWAQLGVIATSVALAQPKTGAMHAIAPNPYLPFEKLEPVY